MSRKKTIFFFLQQISARSHEDNSGASSSISTTSSVMYPPNAMEPRRYVYFVYISQLLVYIFWFHEFMNFRSSTPQSDTDQSDDDEDDDISDHDLTPCKICLYIFFVSLPVCLQNLLISGNPSPNMPGYNWGLGRIPDQDDIEEGLCLQYTFNYIFSSTVYICNFHYLGNFVFFFFRLEKSCTKSQWWSQ